MILRGVPLLQADTTALTAAYAQTLAAVQVRLRHDTHARRQPRPRSLATAAEHRHCGWWIHVEPVREHLGAAQQLRHLHGFL